MDFALVLFCRVNYIANNDQGKSIMQNMNKSTPDAFKHAKHHDFGLPENRTTTLFSQPKNWLFNLQNLLPYINGIRR
jgi:hypothetical protein